MNDTLRKIEATRRVLTIIGNAVGFTLLLLLLWGFLAMADAVMNLAP
jgi:hypothetical protein